MPRSSSRGAERSTGPGAPCATARAAAGTALSSPELDHLLGYLLALAQLPTAAAFRRHVGQAFDLRPVEFTLLMLLHSSHSASPTQIRHALRLPAPHVTTLVDRLAERGLLQRGRDPHDGRAVRISLTVDGAALAARLQPVAARMEDEVQAALTPTERTTLRRLLTKLAGAPLR